MTVVKFKDGKFGIRKGVLWHRYFDLVQYQHDSGSVIFWARNDRFFEDCRGDEDTVRRIFERLTDPGVPW